MSAVLLGLDILIQAIQAPRFLPLLECFAPIFEQKSSDAQIEHLLHTVPNQLLSFKASGRKREKVIDVLALPPCLPRIMLEKGFKNQFQAECLTVI